MQTSVRIGAHTAADFPDEPSSREFLPCKCQPNLQNDACPGPASTREARAGRKRRDLCFIVGRCRLASPSYAGPRYPRLRFLRGVRPPVPIVLAAGTGPNRSVQVLCCLDVEKADRPRKQTVGDWIVKGCGGAANHGSHPGPSVARVGEGSPGRTDTAAWQTGRHTGRRRERRTRGRGVSRGITACPEGSAVGARRFERLVWGLPEGCANPRLSGRCAKWSRSGSNRRPLACHNPAHVVQDALTTLYRGFAYCERCKHSAALREFVSGCAVYTALRAPLASGPPPRTMPLLVLVFVGRTLPCLVRRHRLLFRGELLIF